MASREIDQSLQMEIESLRKEISVGILMLKDLQTSVVVKMHNLQAHGPDFMDDDRVKEIIAEEEQARVCFNQASRKFKESASSPLTVDQLKTFKRIMDMSGKKYRDMDENLDKCQEIFIKFKVPRLVDFSNPGAYALALRAFMRVWKEEAMRERGKGEKNMIEWIRKLDEPDDTQKRDIFNTMRRFVVRLGIRISKYLGLYLFMLPGDNLERKFREVSFTLKRLKVEESSVLIDRFLLTVTFFEREIKKRQQDSRVDFNLRRKCIERVLLYKIFREVLRFEVAFCCPGELPKMPMNVAILYLGCYMVSIFRKNLNGLSSTVKELKTELQKSLGHDEQEDPNRFELETQVLSGVKEIWKNIELSIQIHDSSN